MNLLTPRLELVAATLEIVTADLHHREELPGLLGAPMAAGWPPPLITVEVMQSLKARCEAGEPPGWAAWYVLRREPRMLVGMGLFTAPPMDGAVPIAYTLVPEVQRLGLGTELVHALVEWALSRDEVQMVFADTLPELIASQHVLTRNGFLYIGEGDEEGVWRFERYRESPKADLSGADGGPA
jgi:RimJ/RimL family protein N-acetyltransferase